MMKKLPAVSFILCVVGIISGVGMIYISNRYFAGVYNTSVFSSPCFALAAVQVYFMFKKPSCKRKRPAALYTGLLFLLLTTGFLVCMPRFTVDAAIEKIQSEEAFKSCAVSRSDFPGKLQTDPPQNLFVGYVYCLSVKGEDTDLLVNFDPIGGGYGTGKPWYH
jgi:hypothetical protein